MDAVFLRRSVSPRDELGLRRNFTSLPQHHIVHLLAYKSPCSAHLEAPLGFGSVNLFVVYQMKIAASIFFDGAVLQSDAISRGRHSVSQVFIKLAGRHYESPTSN